ncbi:MAG: acyl-CoA thioesterase [Hyellaceae cyanobacterium CSU_1_1]|nr:acyl-CoA thioesterase [Pleurocapsa sp. CRU_1_2]NJR46189.1 acyl-CoA thioesterase [Hyellaceae cyanobacterium CSU_1_1]
MKVKPLQISLELPIKTYDIDFAGIVSNIVYIRWLEDLRLKMFESNLLIEKLMSKGYCPTVNSTQIKYQKALRLGDRPVGKMWMSQLGRLRCTVQAEIYLGQEIAAIATQVGFFMSLETMRPMAMPEEIKDIYAEYN